MCQTELHRDGARPARRLDTSTQTYMLVSKAAYLAGVERRIFENEHEPLQMDACQNARIIRNLSMLRTEIEQHYAELYHFAEDGHAVIKLGQ